MGLKLLSYGLMLLAYSSGVEADRRYVLGAPKGRQPGDFFMSPGYSNAMFLA